MIAAERLYRLFSELQPLSTAAQAQQLDELAAKEPALAEQLRGLLAADALHEQQAQPVPMQDLLISHAEVPGYRLISQIGSGGMGRVYTGVRVDDPAQVIRAIKLIRSELSNPLLQQRFELECTALAALAHPGVARYIESGRCACGTPYVVMEYVDGEAIDEWANRQRLNPEQRIRLSLQLLAAVAHAHQRLLVHRDIKPANVLVDASGKLTLVDFGVAKSLDTAGDLHTVTAERFLTPRSAAPEQLSGGPIGTGCDVYGLGLLLYRLLSAQQPFDYDAANPLAFQNQVLQVPAPGMASRLRNADPAVAHERSLGSVAELRSALSGDIERVVLRCLRISPDERYQTVDALQRDLRNVLQGAPISERESERLYRLQKFVARNRVPVGLAMSALLVLCIALGVVAHQHERAVHQRDRAASAIALLKEAFAAANPLNLQGGDARVSEVLDAALPLLSERRDAQPALYAELASTIAEVELASGRPQRALTLLENALQAAADSAAGSQQLASLRLLMARSMLEAGQLEELAELLESTPPTGTRASIERRLLKGRLAYLGADTEGALDLLEQAFADSAQLPDVDPLRTEVRLYLAQGYRLAGDNDKALDQLNDTQATLSQRLRPDHPQLMLVRMRQLEYASDVTAAAELLPLALSLADEMESAFGRHSAMLARIRGLLARLYLKLKNPDEAAKQLRLSWLGWQSATAAGHPNALRALFNLALMEARYGSATEDVDRLFRRLLDDASNGAELNPSVLGYWRVSHLEFLADRRQCATAMTSMDSHFPAHLPLQLNSPTRTLFVAVLERLLAECACTDTTCKTAWVLQQRLEQPAGAADVVSP